MTSLDRAKRFISQHGKAIALTIVPLAGLAVTATPAKAGAPTGFSVGTCTVSLIGSGSSAGGCSGSSDGIDPANSLLGVKLYGASGSSAPSATNNGQSAFFGVDIQETGTASLTGLSSLPVSWDFSATSSDGHALTYLLTFTLFGSQPQDVGFGSQVLSQWPDLSLSLLLPAEPIPSRGMVRRLPATPSI